MTDTHKLLSLREWFSPRNLQFWLWVSILLYTLLGFFAVPWLVKSQAEQYVRETVDREIRMGEVHSNPFLLSLEVRDFALIDNDGEAIISFDRFFADFQLSSLFRWAWTFKSIELQGSYVLAERFALEEERLSRLIAEFETSEPEAESIESDESMPRLLIMNFSLIEGSALIRDHVPQPAVDLAMGPISVDIQALSTIPDKTGKQAVDISLPQGAELSWSGDISLAPLFSEGQLSVKGSHLDQTIAYLKAILPLESIEAVLSAQTRYRVEARDDGALALELSDFELDLEQVQVTGLEPAEEFFALPSLSIRGGTLNYPENRLQIDNVLIRQARMSSWLGPNGELSLLQIASSLESSADTAPAESTQPWDISVSKLQVEEAEFHFADRQLTPPGEIKLQSVSLLVEDFNNSEGSVFPTRFSAVLEAGGRVEVAGESSLLPGVAMSGNARFADLQLPLLQPWLEQVLNVDLSQGGFSSTSQFTANTEGDVTVSGAFEISNMELHDTVNDEVLAGWKSAEVDRFQLDLTDAKAESSTLEFEEPYGRIRINADKSLNLDSLMIESAPGDSQPDDEALAVNIVLGGIAINSGTMDFADLSLPLPFATRISSLEGTISTIDSDSQEPATVQMEGQVDDYGLARINGDIAVFSPLVHTDIKMEFRNLLVSKLSPYSVDFAGREIDQGKLDLDLEYIIDQGMLQGSNAIVLSDLVLGKEVDSPDAVSLPLGLAVALLKDANGVIDMDLPVEGDVNDPEFRIGGVIWKAFTGLITKVVSAPFRLLGNLIGVDSEDLGQFQFLAGRSDLTPPELEKITQLQQALLQRPELVVEISGVFDPDIDRPALQYSILRQQVVDLLAVDEESADEAFEVLDEQVRNTLEQLFAQQFPQLDMAAIRDEHRAAPADDPEGKMVLDELAFAVDLRDRLVAAVEVSQTALDELANARATVVQQAFITSGEIGAERALIASPAPVTSEDGKWVVMELGVSID